MDIPYVYLLCYQFSWNLLPMAHTVLSALVPSLSYYLVHALKYKEANMFIKNKEISETSRAYLDIAMQFCSPLNE